MITFYLLSLAGYVFGYTLGRLEERHRWLLRQPRPEEQVKGSASPDYTILAGSIVDRVARNLAGPDGRHLSIVAVKSELESQFQAGQKSAKR